MVTEAVFFVHLFSFANEASHLFLNLVITLVLFPRISLSYSELLKINKERDSFFFLNFSWKRKFPVFPLARCLLEPEEIAECFIDSWSRFFSVYRLLKYLKASLTCLALPLLCSSEKTLAFDIRKGLFSVYLNDREDLSPKLRYSVKLCQVRRICLC